MQKMNNLLIREALWKNNIPNYKAAAIIGTSETTFGRKLREELPIEEQERIVELIEAYCKENH